MLAFVTNDSINNIKDEYLNTVTMCKNLLFKVAGLDDGNTINDEEIHWSNLLLLMAAFGKAVVVKDIMTKAVVTCNGELDQEYKQVENKFTAFLYTSGSKVEDNMAEHFDKFIKKEYESHVKHKKVLESSRDFELYIVFRDLVELFLVGVELHCDSSKFRDDITRLDSFMRQYVILELLPKASGCWSADLSKPPKDEKGKKVWLKYYLENCIDILPLPETFWWRHLRQYV